jgi:D-alanyl-D-alanine carboxypeptidase/D-alanyl-D-alanine-endopeptidase (penicillin-binding protein 4)
LGVRCLQSILITLLALCGHAGSAEQLPEPVRSVLNLREVPADSLSIHVANVETGEVIVDWMSAEPRNPASTLKLMTTLAALDILGPAYSWQTDIYALGPIEDGRLDGDLLIRGTGDPFLVTERVWQLAHSLRRTGLEIIDGDLIVDDTYFDVGPYDPGAFDQQPLRAYNVAPNALLMNFKVIRYWFTPEGEGVRIELDPPLNNVEIDNQLSLAGGPCRGYQRGIAIHANETVDTMTFSGAFPGRCKRYAMSRTALSHPNYVYGLFSAMWRANGGVISGAMEPGMAPADAKPILSFDSLPLGDAISRVNKYSNNVMARQLLYTLSAEVLGPPGTEAGGRQVIENWLLDKGLELNSMSMANGAGLSREARVSAGDMTTLLAWAWRQPFMPEYLASMALSGLDGTLRKRLRGRGLDGRAHLKTGSLDHVAAIAGYLQARSGRRYVLAILHNYEDIHRGYGDEVQDALIRWLNDNG